MMQQPWAPGTIDEWLPRNLRLCWGGGDGDGGGGGFGGDGGGFGGDGGGGFGGDGGGGWGGDGGFGGAATGGGDWGSSGAADLSGFDAGGIGAFGGTAYDASTFGTGAGLGGDWGSFGATNYAGFDAPNPSFADVGGFYGATTGGGDWGSAGMFSAEGTGGGPGGAMFGADTFGTAGGGMYGDPSGGGLFGDYGTGGGGGTYGTGGAFGNFGGGGRGSVTDSTPGYTTSVSGGRDVTQSEMSSPYADDTGPEGRGEQEGPENAPAAEPAAEQFGTPTSEEAPSETAQEAGPSETSQEDAPAETSQISSREAEPSEAPSSFGPQSLAQGLQTLSDLTQTSLAAQPADYQGAPYADLGPQQAAPSTAPTSTAFEDFQGSPYADMGPQGVNWGSVFEAPNDPAYQPDDRSGPMGPIAEPGWFESLISDIPGVQQVQDTAKSITDINTWLAPQNQGVINALASLNWNPNDWANVAQPWTAFDLQALGEQGKASQQTDLASQLGMEDISATQGIDPGSEQYGTEAYAPGGIDPSAEQYATAPDLAAQLGIENISPVDWASVFEAPAQDPDWASVFEGTPSSPDWTSVFEGQPSVDPSQTTPSVDLTSPSVDVTMESGPAGEQTTSDDTSTPGGDPALSGLSVEAAAAAGAPGAPGAPGTPGAAPATAPAQGGQTFVSETAVGAVVNATDVAAQNVDAPSQAADAATQAAHNAMQSLSSPAEVGEAVSAAALANGATQQQAEAMATAATNAAMAQTAFTPSEPGQQQQAPSAPEQPGAPVGPEAPSTTSAIAGGRATDFSYAPAQTQAQPAPSLIDMAQPSTSGTIAGGRTTDFSYPSSTSVGIEPGAEQYGVQDDDDATPEPSDNHNPPADPNAPRPPGNIPGQLIGQNGQYDNPHADTPQTSRTFSNSGRTDYPQGRPGIDFRTARQAGITPLFRTEGINTQDNDARLVENINRALTAMQQRTGIPAGSLVATSGWRGAFRTNGLEHGMDPRTTQESVYSRSNPVNGRHFPAARPGGSNHGPGRAIDFARSPALTWLRAHASEFGLETIANDHPHIQLSGARGNVGARPSAQEQAEQRAIDEQSRQVAIDRGLLAPGRGQAPNQQVGVPMPRGRPSDAPQLEVAAQPNWGAVFEGATPGAVAPTQVPAALPSPTMPLPPETPRPPAEIPAPAPFLSPPSRGRADPKWQTDRAQTILKQATAGLNKDSGQAAFQAASVVAAKALAEAGIPLDMARDLMTKGAIAGAIANGYGPGGPNSTVMGFSIWGKVQSAIAEGIAAALQGYNPGATGPTPQGGRYGPGPVQGPQGFQPEAPAQQRGALPFGFHFAAGGRDVGAPPAVEPGQLPGRAEWETPLPGGIFPGLNPDLGYGLPIDPSELGRGQVIDPDIFPLQQQEQQQYQQQLDPRGMRWLAKGGRVAKDEPVVVGEEGPEYFVPDRPGTVVPHMPQPGKGTNVDRWPKIPAVDYPGRYGGVEREFERQTRAAQNPSPGLMDMIDSGRLRLTPNWHAMLNNPGLIALGRSRMDDRREGIDPGSEQYGSFIPAPAPAAEPPDPTSPMAQALGYGSIRRPMRIGRQIY